jgi:hypothetical protein
VVATVLAIDVLHDVCGVVIGTRLSSVRCFISRAITEDSFTSGEGATGDISDGTVSDLMEGLRVIPKREGRTVDLGVAPMPTVVFYTGNLLIVEIDVRLLLVVPVLAHRTGSPSKVFLPPWALS